MAEPRLEQLTATLRRTVEESWGRILRDEERLLADWTGLRRPERLARLRALRTTVEGLMDAADEVALRWAFRDLPDAYQLGARKAAGAARAAVSFTSVDVDALNSLVFDSHEKLLGATGYVKRSTKELVERLTRDHLADKLVRGLTAEQAGRNLRHELEGHGIASVVYADGSRHGLAEYTDMLAVTRTAEVYQVGGFEQTAALGIEWMEIFDGSGCGLRSHEDPEKANGKILTLDEARLYPLAHPRCGRSTSPRPDITSARQAADARPSTSAAQRADQAAAEQRRTESVAARAQRRRIERQVARRPDGILDDRGARPRSPAAARAQARRTFAASRSSQRTKEAVHRHVTQHQAAAAAAGTTREVAAALSRGLQAPLGRKVPVDLEGLDLEIARTHAQELLRLAEKYPEARLNRISSSDVLPTNAYAGTLSQPGIGSRIDLARAWHGPGNIAGLRTALARDEDARFHPPNTRDPRSVVTHEFAHVLDQGTLGPRWMQADPARGIPSLVEEIGDYAAASGRVIHSVADIENFIAAEVSEYGSFSAAELVAEAFTDVEFNGAAASGLSKLVHARLSAALRVSRQEGVA